MVRAVRDFIAGFRALHFVGPCVTVFGSARYCADHPYYALARDVGSRLDNRAAKYLFDEWLPRSGERIAARPLVFHYVNVGPAVQAHEAITDVYLPLE